jgi:hypothetical protein
MDGLGQHRLGRDDLAGPTLEILHKGDMSMLATV